MKFKILQHYPNQKIKEMELNKQKMDQAQSEIRDLKEQQASATK